MLCQQLVESHWKLLSCALLEVIKTTNALPASEVKKNNFAVNLSFKIWIHKTSDTKSSFSWFQHVSTNSSLRSFFSFQKSYHKNCSLRSVHRERTSNRALALVTIPFVVVVLVVVLNGLLQLCIFLQIAVRQQLRIERTWRFVVVVMVVAVWLFAWLIVVF